MKRCRSHAWWAILLALPWAGRAAAQSGEGKGVPAGLTGAAAPANAEEDDEDAGDRRGRGRDNDSGDNRELSTWYLGYAPVSPGLAVPVKHGPFAGWIIDRDWTVEYAHAAGELALSFGGVNFVSFRETVNMLWARWYPGTTSFHVLMGAGRRDYRLDVGDKILARYGHDALGTDIVRIQQPVASLGLGNRWLFDPGFTAGVDWIKLNWPVMASNVDAPFLQRVPEGDARRRLRGVINKLTHIPTFTVLELQAGWAF